MLSSLIVNVVADFRVLVLLRVLHGFSCLKCWFLQACLFFLVFVFVGRGKAVYVFGGGDFYIPLLRGSRRGRLHVVVWGL